MAHEKKITLVGGAQNDNPTLEVPTVELETFNPVELRAKFDLVPVTTRIFVKRTKVIKVGSIIIPGKRDMELSEGLVLMAGPNCEIVQEGDYISFGRYAGAEIERNGITLVVLDETDTIGKKPVVNTAEKEESSHGC